MIRHRPVPDPRTVAVARGRPSARPPDLLADALDRCGAWTRLAQARRAARARSDRFPVVVVVAVSPPAPADPSLVAHLAYLLREHGYGRVVVAATLTPADRDRGWTDLPAVLGHAGYRAGHGPAALDAVVDLAEDLQVVDGPPTSLLAGHPVAAAWTGAGFRVLVGRAATDAADAFAGVLPPLLAVAPPVPAADPADVTAELLRHLPPDLAVLDATVSSVGRAGTRLLDPLATSTVLAADDAVLAEYALAALAGTDPTASRPLARALRDVGLPSPHRVDGDLSPFDGWRGPTRAQRDTARLVGAAPAVSRVLAAATDPDRPGPNPPDPVLRAVRSTVRPLAGTEPGAALLDGVRAAAGLAASAARDWAAVLAKDRVARVEVPLGFDPDGYAEADYRALTAMIKDIEELLAATPAGPGGLRWRYLDSSVVFETSRVLAAPYPAFAARVDVARGISLMADYLGGRVVPVAWDDDRRVVRQAERNLYLPQPNYLAVWGGLPIDVCKIEIVEYGANERRLVWRSVDSPNGSALYDDGSLTFAADGPDRTRVTVRGRQQFTLPPVVQFLDLDRYPQVKDALVADAYRRFFTATFDNLEASYEGRDFLVGRPARDPDTPLPTTRLAESLPLLREALADSGWGERLARPGRWGPRTSSTAHVDADGFAHFRGPAPGAATAPGTTGRSTRAAPWSGTEGRAGGWWERLSNDLAAAWRADTGQDGP